MGTILDEIDLGRCASKDLDFFESVLHAQYYEKLPDLTKPDAESGDTALGLAIAKFRPAEIICKIAKIMYPSPNKYVHTQEKSAMMKQVLSNEAATRVPNVAINAANGTQIKVRLKLKYHAYKLLNEFQQRQPQSDRVSVTENPATQGSAARHVVSECKRVALPTLESTSNNSAILESQASGMPKAEVEPTKVTEVMPTGFAASHSTVEKQDERNLFL